MKVLILIALFSTLDVFAFDTAKLVKLREEVEVLSLELEQSRKKLQGELDVYLARDTELDSMILKEEFRKSQLATQIELAKSKLSQNVKESNGKNEEIWLKNFWKSYELSLDKANPFLSRAQNEKLKKIKFDFSNKRLSLEHAYIQTFYIIDEDLKKSQDAELVISPIKYKENTYNVEMARVGRSLAFFRTSTGKYGKIFFEDELKISWIEDFQSIKVVDQMLVQFKKQEKTGLYDIPFKI